MYKNYDNTNAWIEKSSINNNRYQAVMYNRNNYAEEPWISLDNHATSMNNEGIMYAENNWSVSVEPMFNINNSNGLNVFIRKKRKKYNKN